MSSKIKKDPSQEKIVMETSDFVVEFRKYKTELTTKYLARKPWEKKDDSKILSFIPGTITKIYVAEGDYVSVGQELLILEAMKMKNTLTAELSGKVKKINIELNQKVPKNLVMIEMELD